MYKPVKFIAEVPYIDFSTYYLFCKKLKTLVPIEIPVRTTGHADIPSVYDSIKRIIYGTGYSILGLKIYRQEGDVFYTYLAIKKNDTVLDINVSFEDGVKISNITSSPIYMERNILETSGIVINKDMVLKALGNESDTNLKDM